MKLLDRYSGYAIVGTFFWFCVMVGVLIVNSCLDNGQNGSVDISLWKLIDSVAAYNFRFSAVEGLIDKTTYSSLISVLGVTTVFATGLVVDVVSPAFYAPFEAFYFKKYFLKEAEAELRKMFDDKDASQSFFEKTFSDFSSMPVISLEWISQRHRYNDLISMLTTYCISVSSPPVLEYLNDKLQMWKMGRALGAAFIITAVATYFFLLFHSEAVATSIGTGLAIFAVFMVLGAVCMGEFMRLCHVMQSIVSIEYNKSLKK